MAIFHNFKRVDFSCKCKCGFAAVDAELLGVLEAIRAHFGKPVNIDSGCRCLEYNKTVKKASPNSYHVKGMAADIWVTGVPPDEVQTYVLSHYPDKYGIGSYKNFTHIDVREGVGR